MLLLVLLFQLEMSASVATANPADAASFCCYYLLLLLPFSQLDIPASAVTANADAVYSIYVATVILIGGTCFCFHYCSN